MVIYTTALLAMLAPPTNENVRIKTILSDLWSSGDSPGLQVAFVRDSHGIELYSMGVADVGANTPVTAQTSMMAYSMTKTFVAWGVLLLEDRGRLSVTAPVTTYLPEFPYGNDVRVSHLLTQTSGLPNPIPLRWAHLVEEHPSFNEAEKLKNIESENSDLKFSPGKKVAYSNLSYWYLGKIIEKVSQTSLQDFFTGQLLTPLEIASEELHFFRPQQDKRIKGYLPKWSLMNLAKTFLLDAKFWGPYENKWLPISPHYVDGPGFGGMIGTAEAFAKILEDWLKPESKTLTTTMKKKFFTQAQNASGDLIEMTMGWHVKTFSGRTFLYKEGGGAGFHSWMQIELPAKTGLVIFANNAAFDVKKLAKALAAQH